MRTRIGSVTSGSIETAAVRQPGSLSLARARPTAESPGEPLDDATRLRMESRFGHDFSNVRVHTGVGAARAADEALAHAFTDGAHIVFARNRYDPGSISGSRLLAHELTHVLQQTGPRGIAADASVLEREAETAAAPARTAMPEAGVQRADEESSAHPAQPTPSEYIESHTNFLGDLKEEALASDLYLLAWQSSSHYEFVLEVFQLLDADNQFEVADAFFTQLRGDSFIEETALTAVGRAFLTSIDSYLPAAHRQRRRVEKIVLAGPQREVEKDRLESIERLEKTGKTFDVTFYTSYEGEDTAEALLENFAKASESRKETDIAIPMADLSDVEFELKVAERAGKADFIRELHLMGHGTENNFGFGEYYYTSEYLRDNYKTGQLSSWMADGGTVYLEGCDVAAGETGKNYLSEVGRIFFGESKTGFIKGSTCKVIAIGAMGECGPRTLRWPGDFK